MADDVAVLALKYLSDFMNRYYGKKIRQGNAQTKTILEERIRHYGFASEWKHVLIG